MHDTIIDPYKTYTFQSIQETSMPTSTTTKTINKINQDDINKAVWNAYDTYRGVISAIPIKTLF